MTKGKPWLYRTLQDHAIIPPSEQTSLLATTIQLSMRVQFKVAGRVVGIAAVQRGASFGWTQVGWLRNRVTLFPHRGVALFKGDARDTNPRWQHAYFTPWVRVAANEELDLSVEYAGTRFFWTTGVLNVGALENTWLKIPQDSPAGNSTWRNTGGTQNRSHTTLESRLWGIDVLFLEDGQT